MSSLSAYWKWLKSRDYVEENVWRGLSLPKEKPKRDEQERPFTDDEVKRLLAGEPHMPELGPIMRIGALTGARIDAIVSLRVKDCEGGVFRFKPQKREAAERLVPIHSALASVVEALTRGKAPADDLFPGIPEPPSGSQRERSMPAVKAFGRYRKTVGVDDTRPGKRRSLVNFHSFRRTFITKAEQAGIPESTIAVVVGHKRPGMTFGTYSGGPTMEQLQACVEAVKLN
jgi:integrase